MRDIFQEIMGKNFQHGAMGNPVIKKFFDHALQALRWEDLQALRTYWDLDTGKNKATYRETTEYLGISLRTLHDRLKRAYSMIHTQYTHNKDQELRKEVAKYQPQ